MDVLILSDSIALPRESPELVALDSTWPYILRKQLRANVIQNSIGAATSDDLLKQTFYYKSIAPKVVLVQCGIVDLAPRAFLPYEIALFERFWISRKLLKWTKERGQLDRIRNFRKVAYVPQSRFRRNLLHFKKQFDEKLFWINVPEQVLEYDFKLPGVAKNIKRYNEIIAEVFGDHVIDVRHFGTDEVMSDYHHFNESGHLKLALKIIEKLTEKHAVE